MLAPYFNYSSYWGVYSRVLHSPGRKHSNVDLPAFESGSYIEVNLTPVNGWPTDNEVWKRKIYGEQGFAEHVEHQLAQVKFCRIRCHLTARDKKDETVTELPSNVLDGMNNNLQKSLVVFLLTSYILQLIDWDKYRKVCNGGADLKDILKDDLEQAFRSYYQES